MVCAETAGAPAMTVSIIITAQALTGDSDCRLIVEVLFEDYPSFSGPAAIIVTKSNSEQANDVRPSPGRLHAFRASHHGRCVFDNLLPRIGMEQAGLQQSKSKHVAPVRVRRRQAAI